MKRELIFIASILLLIVSCKSGPSLLIKNEANIKRIDEVLVLNRTDVEKKIALNDGYVPVFKTENQVIPVQFDDLDGDGKWEQAVLVFDISAQRSKKIEIEQVASEKYIAPEKRTNLRLGIKQDDGSFKEFDNYRALPCKDGFEIIAQAESVSWENDKIAFRVYFDCRNVKDLFGKLKPELVIDKIQTPELRDYHKLADWGMDVLHCGSSLGSGGLALMRNDSLFRLGSTEVYEYKKIVEGPLRSVFELHYSGWNVDGEMLEAVEKITIYPGKYWFESDVTVKGCKEGDQIVTGIVTSKLKREPFEMKAGNFQCIGTHDLQSLNNDELGMAVVVPLSEAGKTGRTTNINFFALGDRTVVEKSFSHTIAETYYIGQNCKTGAPAKHYFFSVWGLDKEQWKTEEGFRKYISEEAEKLSSPVVVN